jgi:hypothetical protein
MEMPISFENGEDIQFAFLAQKYGGIKCWVPPHPLNNRELWGSIRGGEFGNDAAASYKKHNHTSLRNSIVSKAIEKGWRPLFMRKNK